MLFINPLLLVPLFPSCGIKPVCQCPSAQEERGVLSAPKRELRTAWSLLFNFARRGLKQ